MDRFHIRKATRYTSLLLKKRFLLNSVYHCDPQIRAHDCQWNCRKATSAADVQNIFHISDQIGKVLDKCQRISNVQSYHIFWILNARQVVRIIPTQQKR